MSTGGHSDDVGRDGMLAAIESHVGNALKTPMELNG